MIKTNNGVKKINYLFVLLAIFSVLVFGCTQTATQTAENKDAMMEKDDSMQKDTMKDKAMMMGDGFEMKDGKMVRIQEKTHAVSSMENTVTLKDGTKVMTDGKVMRPDGTSFMLKEGESMWMDGSFMEAVEMMEESMTNDDNAMMEKSGYQGKVLAGKTSPYIEFNKEDYDKALKENKKILLYFYANWCPLCKAEQPKTFAAFNELNDPDLVGFRVDYKDGNDDDKEKSLAKEFGVAYQHTKVLLKDGQRVNKWPDSWDKQRYLDELRKI